ncbi:MAG: (2Fe-2S)-binding protein [Nocardioides sp.]|nr:(2Fe-2S)-binding protein [Nocardioides sp.]
MKTQIFLTVNGEQHELWVRNDRTLLDALHDDIGLPDVRYGCGEGVCGTCTVLADNEPINACLTFAVQAQDVAIQTLSGLTNASEELHPLQKCFLEHGAAQCGFCTPGMVLTSKVLAQRNPSATRQEIRYELVGNLCRCTGYTKIVDAVEEYFGQVREQASTGGGDR